MKQRFSPVLFALAALLINGTIAYSTLMQWDSLGVNLRQGYHIEWYRAGAQDPVSGDMVMVWSDCRNGDRDVFAQKFNVSGAPQWDAGGKLIAHAVARQEDPEVIYSENGNWIFAWVDYRLTPEVIEAGDVYTQKVNSSGDPLWTSGGVLVCSATGVQLNLRLVADGSGGVIILWEDNRSGDGNDIYAQRITSTGVPATGWPTNGLVVISYLGRQEEITVDTDGSGGAIVAWTDTRFSGNKNIYAQRVTPQGTLLWNSEGQPICTTDTDQSDPKLCPDGQGGAYIVWLDRRFDPNFGDIFFQRVNSSGTALLTANGNELCTAIREQKECRLIASNDGGAIFCWVDFRNDEGNSLSDIYAQKVNSSGNLLWGSDGLAVCTAYESQSGARLVSDASGGAIIGWEDIRNGNSITDADLYAQRISSAGSPMWAANGVPVCIAPGYQFSVLLKSDLNHGAFFFWGDTRTGSPGLYEQRLNSSGVSQLQQNGVLFVYGMGGNSEDPMMVQTTPGHLLVAWKDFRYGQNACIFMQLLDASGNYSLEQDGRAICVDSLNGNMDSPQLASDFQNGGFLVWKEQRNPNLYNQIYAQRINSNGNTLWTAGGIYVFSIDAGQQNPYIAGDETGGAFVVWSGNTVPGNLHVYAQRLNASGTQVWAQPVEVSNGVDTDDEVFGAVPDGEGGVIITWKGGPWPNFIVFAQKLDANGNSQWQAGGLRLCNTTTVSQEQPTVIADGSGGGIFAWRDKRDSLYYNIFAQRLDRTANFIWPDTGLMVCNIPSDKQEIKMTLDVAGNIFMAWQDFRSGMDQDIYLQKITPSGTIVFPIDGLPICVLGGDQQNPELVSDTQYGVYITWESYLDSTKSDILCQHIDSSGGLASFQWQVNGSVANNALFWQLDPAIGPDGDGGCIIAWEDGRSSGKEQTYNLFAQRMNDFTVGVRENGTVSLPTEFRLEQNYPNPFNPATRISYSLAHAGRVKLMIYDILGRKVRTLQNQFMTAGSHSVIWNGVTTSGDPVASGIYFYKLEVNNHSEIRKMVLLK